MFENIVIISGGQSGADRAGLDAALLYSIKIAGYVPKYYKCEDNFNLKKNYPTLVETNSQNYSVRTNLNVKISDVGLIFRLNSNHCPGTNLTIRYYESFPRKKFIIIDNADDKDIEKVKNFIVESIKNKEILKINVAGIRESKNPGAYQRTLSFLKRLFSELQELV